MTALVRPAALCLDPRRVDRGGVLVTPHLTGRSADSAEAGDRRLFDPGAVLGHPAVNEVRRGCLPKGRYAVSLVYPTGQAWTVPNEAGGCAQAEGAVRVEGPVARCSVKDRAVLLSQGARAVVEIIEPIEPAICEEHPVPPECLPP